MTLSYYGTLGIYGVGFVGSVASFAGHNQWIDYNKYEKMINICMIGSSISCGLLFAGQLLYNDASK
jgi:hypothetical protein